uniref:Uncharacterized protein n=1 Tax=Panagrolaimus sp. JU765 TaxID=591449 RepID=A0AC34Q103_9BILA
MSVFAEDETNRGFFGLKTEVVADIIAGFQIIVAICLATDNDWIVVADIIAGFQIIVAICLATDNDLIVLIFGYISIISNLSVFVAHWKKSHAFYWPYFLSSGFSLMIETIILVILVVCTAMLPKWWMNIMVRGNPREQTELRAVLRIITGVFTICFAFFWIINLWFFKLVYVAYKNMKTRNGLNQI